MNTILLSVIGLLGIFITGVVVYGALGKSMIGENAVPLTPTRFAIAAVGMFVAAYSFIYLFNHVTLNDMTGVTKGVTLGLLIGVPFIAVPIFADAPYFKSSKEGIEWVVIINWVLSLVVLGALVGALA